MGKLQKRYKSDSRFSGQRGRVLFLHKFKKETCWIINLLLDG